MFLDLTGKTVTQALALFQRELGACVDREMEIKVDNEAVKLNLYNHLHKIGLKCKLEKQGNAYRFHVRTGKRKKRVPVTDDMAAPGRKTAFPTRHVTGNKTADADASRVVRPPAGHPNPTTRRAAMPLGEERVSSLAEPGWLIIQCDQIGQRDIQLGGDLLEDVLRGLDRRQVAGVFLIHRGVRLLDPDYREGRLLQLLLQKKIQIRACAKSIGFYRLEDKVRAPIRIVPAGEILQLTNLYPVTWL